MNLVELFLDSLDLSEELVKTTYIIPKISEHSVTQAVFTSKSYVLWVFMRVGLAGLRSTR